MIGVSLCFTRCGVWFRAVCGGSDSMGRTCSGSSRCSGLLLSIGLIVTGGQGRSLEDTWPLLHAHQSGHTKTMFTLLFLSLQWVRNE